MSFKAAVDRLLCIGTGNCVATAPNTFVLDSEAKSVVKKQNGDSDETVLEAAKSCPVLAITIEDDEGNHIFP